MNMKTDTIHSMDFDAIRLRVASPEVIRGWSSGEVVKPETINYRTQKPEKGGLFAEEIFGPTKDWECYCGKYKKIRYKGIVCDKCGVEVTHSLVRRERMGHVELASPVTHIWFLRSIPSKIGTILDLSIQMLEKVIYYANFIVTEVNEDVKAQTVDALKEEYKSKRKQLMNQAKQKKVNVKGDAAAIEEIEEEFEQKLAALEEDFVEAERELKEIVPMKLMSENAFQELSLRYGHIFDAQIGAAAVEHLLKKLDLPKTIDALDKEIAVNKTAKRDKMIRRVKLLKSLEINGIHPDWMILKVIPIIPPDMRPMVALDGGRFATSDLNDLYRRVINRNNRLKRLLDLKAPEVITRNERRMLQEAVDALIDNDARRSKTVTASTGQRRKLRSIADNLKGKQGRFRQNLLGKRTDYSGRSVIVVGPNMSMSECGLPKRMALELFKPFVMAKIIERGFAHNIRSASRFIEADHDEVWDILEEVIVDTRVFLNRAPTLHRLGIQSFRPRLVEGKAVRLHPLVCSAFNADFDGDQMAVHVPLTEKAKWEAENLMAAERNILKPATGNPIATPKQDITLGCFYLTKAGEDFDTIDEKEIKRFGSLGDARYAYKLRRIGLHEPIEVYFDRHRERLPEDAPQRVKTTVGRIIFNDVLPEKLPWYNEMVTGKKLAQIVRLVLEHYGEIPTSEVLDNMKALGFKYVTKSGYSLGMDDFPHVESKRDIVSGGDKKIEEIEMQYQEGLLTQNERYTKIIGVWTDVKDDVLKQSGTSLNTHGPVYAMIESGARGSWGQLGQVIGMKGLVSNPSGDIIELPVKGNFKEGFSVLEFFISSHGVRKGLTDTALRTANAGYLTRRLVDVSQDVVVLIEDCGTEEGSLITREESEKVMGESLMERVRGRYALETVKKPGSKKVLAKAGEMITEAQAREIDALGVEEVSVRSVLKCLLPKGICRNCYGVDLAKNKPAELGTAVGIIAAQSIGEPGTQLTMRTFHTGGVAGQDITQGLPRVEELFEARQPKKKAVVTTVSGTATVESAEGRVIESPTGRKIFEGRRGQKIVKVTYDGVDEEVYKVRVKDNLLVEDGASVTKGQTLLEVHDADPIIAIASGTIRLEKRKMFLVYEGTHEKEFIVPLGYKVLVKDGDLVSSGDPVTEGHMDLHQLHELRGRGAVQEYILHEIQDIYSSQGQKLNDKHIEIILRQMFSRHLILDPADTDLLPGETVEVAQVHAANASLGKGKKKAETQELFLGISRVALSTQSFLSAASFQETAKVLINAAVTGKIDYLEGLKENVIIGRRVPAGTGFKGNENIIPDLKPAEEPSDQEVEAVEAEA